MTCGPHGGAPEPVGAEAGRGAAGGWPSLCFCGKVRWGGRNDSGLTSLGDAGGLWAASGCLVPALGVPTED